MPRIRNFLLYPVMALLAALGLMLGLGSAGGASTAGASQAPGAAAVARAAISSIKLFKIGHHSPDLRVPTTPRALNGVSQVESTNWSGYADTGSGFSQAAASWTEPSASCSRHTTSYAAFWVGIDGYSSSTVEQDGTIIECYHGSAFQYSWWEMYPTNDIQVVGSSVAAGDSITASVVRSGTSYTLKVTDSTHPANSFSTNQSCSGCANSSAEWIAEAPSGSSGILPLADFGSWTESGATVTEGSTSGVISSFTDDEITMIDSSGLVKAQPSALNGSGNGFSVTWERSS
jgi:Peptidase A4 family